MKKCCCCRPQQGERMPSEAQKKNILLGNKISQSTLLLLCKSSSCSYVATKVTGLASLAYILSYSQLAHEKWVCAAQMITYIRRDPLKMANCFVVKQQRTKLKNVEWDIIFSVIFGDERGGTSRRKKNGRKCKEEQTMIIKLCSQKNKNVLELISLFFFARSCSMGCDMNKAW